MAERYEILVKGNSLRLKEGYLGLANISLIRTQAGPMLFDLGHSVNRPALVAGLAQKGMKPADVKRIFLSHIHFDHVNNIDLFSYDTEVFVSRADWEYAANPHPDDDFVPWMVREQLSKYRLRLLDGAGEFEAGLQYFPVPGHTPGSYAVSLDDPALGRVVLAGDAIKFPRELMTCQCTHAYDLPERGSASIRMITGMADRIVPGHFSELIRADGGFTWDEDCRLELVVR